MEHLHRQAWVERRLSGQSWVGHALTEKKTIDKSAMGWVLLTGWTRCKGEACRVGLVRVVLRWVRR